MVKQHEGESGDLVQVSSWHSSALWWEIVFLVLVLLPKICLRPPAHNLPQSRSWLQPLWNFPPGSSFLLQSCKHAGWRSPEWWRARWEGKQDKSRGRFKTFFIASLSDDRNSFRWCLANPPGWRMGRGDEGVQGSGWAWVPAPKLHRVWQNRRRGILELDVKVFNLFQEKFSSFSSTIQEVKERTVESLNLPKDCNLSFATFNSRPNFFSSPPPSYSSDSPPTYTLPANSTFLEFHVLLNPKEESLMSSCLDRLLK